MGPTSLVAMITSEFDTEGFSLGTWRICAHAPGQISHPDQLPSETTEWLPATAPGTVASALRDAGLWDFDHPTDIDGRDWWWQSKFLRPSAAGSCELVLSGLATLAEIWLNGRRLLVTDNMFREYRLDIQAELQDENELVIGFRSLTTALQVKRPRPRWKTNLVSHQQLRWFRSTLLGHMPGWSPPVPTVGPWRAIRIETAAVRVISPHLTTEVRNDRGIVNLRCRVSSAIPLISATLCVGAVESALDIEASGQDSHVDLHGRLELPRPELWWPHTHGSPHLYDATLKLSTIDGTVSIPLNRVGFRHLEINRVDGGFGVQINGQPIYCRGACWTVSDLFTLDGTAEQLRRDLQCARDAGANMLRVGGTMIYESDAYLALCDELGILVWQDFPFANMDYPVDEPEFRENIVAEARGQITRQAAHPSLVIYCGGSEIEQQAAMLGLPAEMWTNPWFAETLPELVSELNPGAAYVQGSPTGGTLPFDPQEGVSHFYGIGAYRRSLRELRQADVRFTTECLGFSNIPEPSMVSDVMEGGHLAAHDPRWKRRVPRDSGASWDFEDIRDHYLQELYGVEAVKFRAVDPARYEQLSRTVPGEMMARTFAEWRRGASRNRGGLVWFYKDLWPGAGWGILDSNGMPKATYYYLRRNWQPRAICMTDEGLSGLHLHVVNEASGPLEAAVELTLLKQPNVVIAQVERPVTLSARETRTLTANDLLGRFYDVNHAYRFGPAAHDIVVATLLDTERQVLSQSCYFLKDEDPRFGPSPKIQAKLAVIDARTCELELNTDVFLHTVRLHAKGYVPADNYFHLPPGHTRKVRFHASFPVTSGLRVDLQALNLDGTRTITPSLPQQNVEETR